MMRHFSHVLMSVGCLLLSTATVLMATELHVEYGQVAHWLTAGRLQVTPDNANINTDRTEPYEVIFALKQQNIEKIEELLQHISNPSDEEYGLYWTEDALKQVTFCEEGLQSLEAYLKRYHIVIPPQQIQEKTSYLKVSATIQQWEEVFQTTFQSYAEVNGPFTGLRASSLSLPVDIWQHLQGVFNVIDLPLSSFTSNVDDSVVQSVLQKTGMQWLEAEEVISPTLLRQLYDMPATSSFPGYAAVSQAIFASNHDDRNISRSDLQKFLREYSSGVSMTEVTSIGNRLSYPPCTSCALSESSTVAMEYLTTLGRDIATTFYYKERKGNVNFWVDWVLEISRMKNSPNVIAITTYDYEADVLPAIAQAFNIEVMKLGIRGVTVLVTSGVDGVAGPAAKDDSSKCGYRPIFPATSPFVTVVGSTMVSMYFHFSFFEY